MLENINSKISKLPYLLNNMQVVVIYGGFGKEREVSLVSGQKIFQALYQSNINVIKYELTQDIVHLWTFLINLKDRCVVFNALHGSWGEDGTLAAILDSLNISYTHAGITASSVAMNKFLTKKIASSLNILVIDDILFNPVEGVKLNHLSYPIIMKPNNEGSSVDVFLINNEVELTEALLLVKDKYKEMLIEEFLPGAEYSVGLIQGKALEVTQIIPNGDNIFYNFQAKYVNNGSTHILPAKISENCRNYMFSCAEKIYSILRCKSVARVDFKEKNGKVYFLELNTHPGFTPTSLLPEQAEYLNISFETLCLFVLFEALNKNEPNITNLS